jgi:bleomycin hydrolase
MKVLSSFLAFMVYGATMAQVSDAYTFKILKQNDALPVCSQGNTGTCWSFSTASFLESEIIRMGHKPVDLSEMHIVKNVYKEKADNYVRYHGKTNFGQGSLAHDYLQAAEKNGLVPNKSFHPDLHQDKKHNHKEVFTVLNSMVKTYSGSDKLSPNWKKAINGVLDGYFGDDVETFSYDGEKFSPKTFSNHLGIDFSKYRHVTSYKDFSMAEPVILPVPDNWSNGKYDNVPLFTLWEMVEMAVLNGYTLSWDADVSNKGFNSKDGIAIVPTQKVDWKTIKKPAKEKTITADDRQKNFDNHVVTDDHLMHITGMAKDQNGTKYLVVKNSWGTERGLKDFEGYIFVSEAYFKLNTISITFHQDALMIHR